MQPQYRIMTTFFLQPLAFGAWLPRIPEIQARLGLEPSELALGLLGMPLGLLLSMPFAGPLVSRVGGRNAVRWSFPMFLAAMPLPATSFSMAALFLALMACGVAMAIVELGMNIVADEVEKHDGVAIMSRCHGFWSLGMVAGSLVGSGLAALQLAPHLSVSLTAICVLPLAILVPASLTDNPVASTATGKTAGLFVPGLLLMAICVVGLASNLAEGVVADWSAVYLTGLFDAAPGAAGLGYAAYALMMALGRFAGDALRTRFGAVNLLRCCYGLAALGVLLLVLSQTIAMAVAGFALVGIGGSVGVPLAISAAASAGGRPPAANVAMVTLVSLIAFLLGPPLIGLIAQHWTLRTAFTSLLLPVFLLGLACSASLRPSRP